MSDPIDFQKPPDVKIKVTEDTEKGEKKEKAGQLANADSTQLPQQAVSLESSASISRSKSSPPQLIQKPKQYFHLDRLPLVIFLTPILAAIICLAIDPPARLIFEAGDSDPQRMINKLTAAIKIRPDLETYTDRIPAYAMADSWEARTANVQTMVDRGIGDSEIYNDLALTKAIGEGTTPQVIELLNKSAQLSLDHCRIFPLSGQSSALATAGYDLLSCGHPEMALQIAAGPTQLLFQGDEKQILKVFVMRESAKDSDSTRLYEKLTPSRGIRHAINPKLAYHAALLALDHSDLNAAKYYLNQGNESLKHYQVRSLRHLMLTHDQVSWLRHLITAWIGYDEGAYAKAVHEADEAIRIINDGADSVTDFQALSSMHLLRAKAQEKLGQIDKAKKSMSDYLQNKMTGRFFVPKEHRDWLRTD
ncbi:MAG: hypothetical protein KGS72_27450 [Cyanobacteria bacterium REEB67]|nr:hypothetical protein [Cyanobacteria bacterium REEB67]